MSATSELLLVELSTGEQIPVPVSSDGFDRFVSTVGGGGEYVVHLLHERFRPHWREAFFEAKHIVRPNLELLCVPYLEVVDVGRLRDHWTDRFAEPLSARIDDLARRLAWLERPAWSRRSRYVALVRRREPSTLEQLLATGEPRGPQRAALATRVVAAVAEAKRCGIAHGNITMASFVGEGDRWRLADFGLPTADEAPPVEQVFDHDVRKAMRIVGELFGSHVSAGGAVRLDPRVCDDVTPAFTDLVREFAVLAEHADEVPTAQELDDAVNAVDRAIVVDLWTLRTQRPSPDIERVLLASSIQDAQLSDPLCRVWYSNVYHFRVVPPPVGGADAPAWGVAASGGHSGAELEHWLAKGPDEAVLGMLHEIHLETLADDDISDDEAEELLADEITRWDDLRRSILSAGFRILSRSVQAERRQDFRDTLAALYRGELVAVEEHGEILLPEFQFTARGRPVEVIFVCNGILGIRGPSWTLADWWWSPKEELDGLSPAAALQERSRWASLVEAAHRDGDLTVCVVP